MSTKQSKRGGIQDPPGGRPAGTTNEAKGLPTAKRVNVRLYPQNLQDAQELIKMGYGFDRSDVIRKALREALERGNRHAV